MNRRCRTHAHQRLYMRCAHTHRRSHTHVHAEQPSVERRRDANRTFGPDTHVQSASVRRQTRSVFLIATTPHTHTGGSDAVRPTIASEFQIASASFRTGLIRSIRVAPTIDHTHAQWVNTSANKQPPPPIDKCTDAKPKTRRARTHILDYAVDARTVLFGRISYK